MVTWVNILAVVCVRLKYHVKQEFRLTSRTEKANVRTMSEYLTNLHEFSTHFAVKAIDI